jgi:hypothetical protein
MEQHLEGVRAQERREKYKLARECVLHVTLTPDDVRTFAA